MMTPVVICDRLASVTRPSAIATPITTSPATTMATVRVTALRGNGFGTCRPCSPRLRRKNTYWANPSAIPTAAAPKPQWNPMRVCSRPVINGPMKAPKLMPR